MKRLLTYPRCCLTILKNLQQLFLTSRSTKSTLFRFEKSKEYLIQIRHQKTNNAVYKITEEELRIVVVLTGLVGVGLVFLGFHLRRLWEVRERKQYDLLVQIRGKIKGDCEMLTRTGERVSSNDLDKLIYWSLLNGKHQNPEILKKFLTNSLWLLAEFDFAQKLWSTITDADDLPGVAANVEQDMMTKNS